MISSGALTDQLLSTLGVTGITIGDGVAPQEAGWTTGTPNTGGFVPYSVVSFNGATPTHPEIHHGEPEWEMSFSLRHYGGSRAQADWVADAIRSAVIDVNKAQFGSSDKFRVIGVRWLSLGALNRNDTVDPPYWQSQDAVILIASRVRIPIQ